MKIASTDRALLAGMLIACILLGLFSCSLRHGQSTGLALSGIFNGEFCSLHQSAGAVAADIADPADGASSMLFFSCPFCGTLPVGAVLSLALCWLLRLARKSRPVMAGECSLSPRHAWPPANPRAP